MLQVEDIGVKLVTKIIRVVFHKTVSFILISNNKCITHNNYRDNLYLEKASKAFLSSLTAIIQLIQEFCSSINKKMSDISYSSIEKGKN